MSSGTPPCSIEAEESCLGSMMIEESALEKGLAMLQAGDFYREVHQHIFEALAALAERDEPCDLITLQEELRKRGKLEECGGTEYLMALVESVPTAANIEYYARIVREKYELRRQQQLAAQLTALTRRPDANPADVRSWLLEEIERNGGETHPTTERLFSSEDLLAGELEPVRWAVEGLIPAGGISMLTGDSGVGKSWLALHLAQCVAAGIPFLGRFSTAQTPALVFDAESGDSLIRRRYRKLFNGLIGEGYDPPTDLSVCVCAGTLSLGSPAEVKGVVGLIRRLQAGLVVCDPLIHSLPEGASENDSVAMARFFESVRYIIQRTGAAFVFVHHSRKRAFDQPSDAGQMLRGSSAIKAILDSHLFVRKLRPGVLHIEHEKSRHAEAVEPFLVEIRDCDAESTTVVYAGETQEAADQGALAQAFIERVLTDAGGSLPRRELLERAKGEGFKERTICNALKAGVDTGTLTKERAGNSVVYTLTAQENLYED